MIDWQALPLQHKITIVIAAIAILFYFSSISPLIISIWCMIGGSGLGLLLTRYKKDVFPSLIRPETRPTFFFDVNLAKSSVVLPECPVCSKSDCERHPIASRDRSVSHPWERILVHRDIDNALQKFIEKVIETYAVPWYLEITNDSSFLSELRLQLRFVLATAIAKFEKFDIRKFVMKEIPPILRDHLKACVESQRHLRSQHQLYTLKDVENMTIPLFKDNGHYAIQSAENEEKYLRIITDRILSHLLSKEALDSQCMVPLLREVVCNLILKTIFSAIVNPNFINKKLYDLFSPESSPIRHLSNDPPVPFLSGCDATKQRSWALATKLADVLHSQEILKPFQDYMKEQNGLNFLLFCGDVENYTNELQSLQMNGEMNNEAKVKRVRAAAIRIFEDFLAPETGLLKYEGQQTINSIRDAIKDSDGLLPPHLFSVPYSFYFSELEYQCRVFLQSRHYFEYVCGSQEGPKKLKTSFQPSFKKASSKQVSEEIKKLNLPLPPSEMDDDDLPQIEIKKQASKADSDTDHSDRLSIGTEKSVPNSDDEADTTIDSSALTNFEDDNDYCDKIKDYHVDIVGAESLTRTTTRTALSVGMAAPVTIYSIRVFSHTAEEGMKRRKGAQQQSGQQNNGDRDNDSVILSPSRPVLSWIIKRKFREFESLEKMLKQLYSDYTAVFPKSKIFKSKTNDLFLEQRRIELENYLVNLLRNQLIRQDQRCARILYFFFQADDSFKTLSTKAKLKEAVNIIVDVLPPVFLARSIIKIQKGRSSEEMDRFVRTFSVTANALEAASKKSISIVVPPAPEKKPIEQEDTSYVNKLPHPNPFPPCPPVFTDSAHTTTTINTFIDNIFRIILDFLTKSLLFWIFRPLLGLVRFFFRNTIENALEDFIMGKLAWVLSEAELLTDIQQVHDIVFGDDDPIPTEEEKRQKLEAARKMLNSRIPFVARLLVGMSVFDDDVDFFFTALQSKMLNKQLLFRIFDALVAELFPEKTETNQ